MLPEGLVLQTDSLSFLTSSFFLLFFPQDKSADVYRFYSIPVKQPKPAVKVSASNY